MKKIINKLLSLFLAVTMCFTVTPVFAASIGSISSDISVGEDTAQNAQTRYSEVGEGTANTDVYLTIDDNNIVVGVPTEIIVSGTPDENGVNFGEYSVSAVGDIAGNKELTITPNSSTVTLTQTGKNDVTATITQEKTVFTSGELANGTTSNGRITANLTAGSWKGNTTFTVSLGEQLLNGYTALYEYDLSATESDDVKAYYMVPNANTKPIEIETVDSITASANLLSTIKSLFQPLTVYAAENNIIEYNGVKYELSADDVLVISGNGEMKENVQSDLINYSGIQQAVCDRFNAVLVPSSVFVENKTETYKKYGINKNYISFGLNEKYPTFANYYDNLDETYGFGNGIGKPCDYSFMSEINQYIDEIYSQYIVSLPKEITIKDGVTNVSNNAFTNCSSVETVTIGKTVCSIGTQAFYNCLSLRNVVFENSPATIGEQAFRGCTSLSNLELGNSITRIERLAFHNCAMTELIIPDTTTYIGSLAFANCKLKTVVLGNGVQTIVGSFSGNPITSLDLGNSIKNIGGSSFSSCKSLTQLIIPDSVETIGDRAFSNCSNLTDVVLGSGIKNIGPSAFTKCDNVENVYISDVAAYCNIEYDINSNKNDVWETTPFCKSTYEGANLYLNNELVTNLVIPNSVTVINPYLFAECKSLESVTFGANTTVIGESSFSGCEGLTSVTIPSSVTSIGVSAFSSCTGLTSVTIPSSVTSIESFAFSDCTGLTSVTIPSSVTSIGVSAFLDCTGLTSVTIPSSVTSIGTGAFVNLASNSTIYCETQAIADLLSGKYTTSKTTVVVSPERFS